MTSMATIALCLIAHIAVFILTILIIVIISDTLLLHQCCCIAFGLDMSQVAMIMDSQQVTGRSWVDAFI